MRAMQFERFGDPEVLTEAEVPNPVAGPGETLVEVEAAGVNFGDIKHIAGEHTEGPNAPRGPLPRIPGMEVVGRTADGRRVLGYVPQGGYAAKTAVPDRDLVALPEGVSAGQALALLIQGLTAWHVLRSVARVRPGESVVVHAAAGGTGSLAVQLALKPTGGPPSPPRSPRTASAGPAEVTPRPGPAFPHPAQTIACHSL